MSTARNLALMKGVHSAEPRVGRGEIPTHSLSVYRNSAARETLSEKKKETLSTWALPVHFYLETRLSMLS